MLAPNSSQHPLFVRIKSRNTIFNTVQPSELETGDNAKSKEFLSLFNEPPEKQQQLFAAENSVFPDIFVQLVGQNNVPKQLNLLFAFIDRIFDIDFNETIDAIVAFRDEEAAKDDDEAKRQLAIKRGNDLISYCNSILLGKIDQRREFPFLIRTDLLLLGALFGHQQVECQSSMKTTFVNKVTKELLNGKIEDASLALEGLKRFLTIEENRQMFIQEKGIQLLINLLQEANKLTQTDTTYHILFCIWTLTYSPEGSAELSTDDFVSILGRMLSVMSVKSETEVLIRVMVAIVKQLNPNTIFIESAYDNDILRLLRLYQTKRYVDPELPTNIVQVADELMKGLKHISLWDKYVREVNSGTLRFSVSHKSDIFWKQNIERFGENNYRILSTLTSLLESEDETTVVVACHDLGEYATRSPVGRVKLEELQTKTRVLALINSKSPKIQREALRTTQLLLLRNQ